eukprot:m.93450 g.93450  ORF g.93450 m.93450 type:complete len:163 (+) comp13811_c0_seq1:137-625(+)
MKGDTAHRRGWLPVLALLLTCAPPGLSTALADNLELEVPINGTAQLVYVDGSAHAVGPPATIATSTDLSSSHEAVSAQIAVALSRAVARALSSLQAVNASQQQVLQTQQSSLIAGQQRLAALNATVAALQTSAQAQQASIASLQGKKVSMLCFEIGKSERFL